MRGAGITGVGARKINLFSFPSMDRAIRMDETYIHTWVLLVWNTYLVLEKPLSGPKLLNFENHNCSSFR